MTRLIPVLLAGTMLAAPAFADPAKPNPPDPNIRVAAFNPLRRVTIIGTINRVTNITYAKAQQVVRVTLGDDVWEGPSPDELKSQPLKNNLPLWPRKPGRTNLVVTTEDDKGTTRSYQYVLISRPAQEQDDPEATYGLIQTDPTQELVERTAAAQITVTAQRTAWRAARAAKLEADARAKLVSDRAAAPKNLHYTGWGSASIAPTGGQVNDDGQMTYLLYAGGSRVPAVFSVAADGVSEQTEMTSMDGQWLVVHRVANELHLRLGNAVLYVFNRAYNPVGINPATGRQADPETGTSSPNVHRLLRRASLP